MSLKSSSTNQRTREELLSQGLAERWDTDEGARDFFRRRAAGATREDFIRVLDMIPHRAPDPGDEL